MSFGAISVSMNHHTVQIDTSIYSANCLAYKKNKLPLSSSNSLFIREMLFLFPQSTTDFSYQDWHTLYLIVSQINPTSVPLRLIHKSKIYTSRALPGDHLLSVLQCCCSAWCLSTQNGFLGSSHDTIAYKHCILAERTLHTNPILLQQTYQFLSQKGRWNRGQGLVQSSGVNKLLDRGKGTPEHVLADFNFLHCCLVFRVLELL